MRSSGPVSAPGEEGVRESSAPETRPPSHSQEADESVMDRGGLAAQNTVQEEHGHHNGDRYDEGTYE